MTHELKHIVQKALALQDKGLRNVLATVVALKGSSYRKPGVRMLICEDGQMVGAVSGGCVERDIARQAQSVFQEGVPKVMTYDGRYRLGCEGLLYILIEPLFISKDLMTAFSTCLKTRGPIEVTSFFAQKEAVSNDLGTIIAFQKDSEFTLRPDFAPKGQEAPQVFRQRMEPCFRLLIFGGEHDAVQLSKMASLLGWEVHVVTSVKDPKSPADFPGAASVTAQAPELLDIQLDDDTAVVLMNHNYVQDLKYALQLEPHLPRYIGILGSRKRREKLEDDLFQHKPDLNTELLERIYSPAGLHIGSITPEEIALSILAEILAVYRGVEATSLSSLPQKKTSS